MGICISFLVLEFGALKSDRMNGYASNRIIEIIVLRYKYCRGLKSAIAGSVYATIVKTATESKLQGLHCLERPVLFVLSHRLASESRTQEVSVINAGRQV